MSFSTILRRSSAPTGAKQRNLHAEAEKQTLVVVKNRILCSASLYSKQHIHYSRSYSAAYWRQSSTSEWTFFSCFGNVIQFVERVVEKTMRPRWPPRFTTVSSSSSSQRFLKWPKQQRHHEDHYIQSRYRQYQSVL